MNPFFLQPKPNDLSLHYAQFVTILFLHCFLVCYHNNSLHTHTHGTFNQQDLPGLQPSVPASLVSRLTPVPDIGRIANFLWIGFLGAGLHAFALPEFTK